jgi:hypothetical protein
MPMDWVGALLSERWIPFRNLHFVNHRLREGLKSHQFKKKGDAICRLWPHRLLRNFLRTCNGYLG